MLSLFTFEFFTINKFQVLKNTIAIEEVMYMEKMSSSEENIDAENKVTNNKGTWYLCFDPYTVN